MADTSTALAPRDETTLGILAPLPESEPALEWRDIADRIATSYEAFRIRTDAGETNNPGRPSLIADRNLIAHLLQAIADGLTPSQAANSLGLSAQAVAEWMRRAERADNPRQSAYAAFKTACETAKDRRRKRLLAKLDKASEKEQHWTAAAWLLERGYGNDYKLAQTEKGQSVVIQIGVKAEELRINIPEAVDTQALSDE